MGLLLLMMTGSTASVSAQTIELTEFDFSHDEEEQLIRIRIAAEGKDVDVNSYYVGMSRRPLDGPDVLPGFWRSRAGRDYLESSDGNSPGPNILLGGTLDQAPDEDVLELHIDVSDWPLGPYTLRVGGHNRPAPGSYVSKAQSFDFRIGDGPDEDIPVSNLDDVEHQVVYKKEGIYACFPQMTRAPEGHLLITFATRTNASHIDGTGGTVTMASYDEGHTWEPTDESFVNEIWLKDDGVLRTARSVGWIEAPASQREQLEAEGRRVRHVREGTVAYLGGAVSQISRDGGRTWQREQIRVPDAFSGTMTYHRTAAEVVTDEGIHLVAIYGRRLPDADGKLPPGEALILRSEDDGQTWTCEPMYPDGLPDPSTGFDETALAVLDDGRIIAMMRSQPANYLYQSISEDGGQTWSDPQRTTMRGYPAEVRNLPDGRLLCTYGYRHHPMGVRASISDNNAESWDAVPTIILRADGVGDPSDIGYPISVVLDSGEILTSYYHHTDEGITHVALTRWTPPESAN